MVEEIAELVQRTCKYRWVGVYKIMRHEFVIEAATNKMKPACAAVSGNPRAKRAGDGGAQNRHGSRCPQ